MGRVCMVEAHYQQYIDRGLATQGVVETRGCGACVCVWWRHTISSTLTEAWLLRVWWRPGGCGVCVYGGD